MEERSRDVIGLLEELTEQNRQQTASLKKQLFVTRILAAAGCVLAAAVIAVFLLIVPPMLQIISQGQETLVEATDTLQTAQEQRGVKPGDGEVKPDGHRKLKQRDP